MDCIILIDFNLSRIKLKSPQIELVWVELDFVWSGSVLSWSIHIIYYILLC